MAGVGWGGVVGRVQRECKGGGQSPREGRRVDRDGPLAGRLVREMNVLRMTGSKFITVRERRYKYGKEENENS